MAAAMLSGLLFLLHFVAVIKPKALARPTFTVDRLGPQVESREVTIAGSAPAHTRVVVIAGDRRLGQGTAGPDGRYSVAVTLPLFAAALRVEGMGPVGPGKQAETFRNWVSIPPWRAGLVEPSIDLAIYLEDAALLWVAGQAGHRTALHLTVDDRPEHAWLFADGGIFDEFIRLDVPPARVSVTTQGTQAPHASAVRDVTRTKLADMPLARRVAVQVLPEWKLRLQVSLPAAHPLLAAARQGYLDGHTAVAATLGWVSALRDPSIRVTGTTDQGTLAIDSGGWSSGFSLRRG